MTQENEMPDMVELPNPDGVMQSVRTHTTIDGKKIPRFHICTVLKVPLPLPGSAYWQQDLNTGSGWSLYCRQSWLEQFREQEEEPSAEARLFSQLGLFDGES